jgi:hypothetical protein
MGSLATFKASYLATTVVPTGQRQQLAGVVYFVERLVADGATVTAARSAIPTGRLRKVGHDSQKLSSPLQATLASDLAGLDAA